MSEHISLEMQQLENITLPRGSGYIVKIARNKQRPYCARRYLYTDASGNSHSKDIGYFKTRAEANRALLEHISLSALDLQNASRTFSEVYDIWYAKAKLHLSGETLRSYRSSYKKCDRLYDRVYADISTADMQRIVSNESSATNQRRLKDLFCKLDHQADSMDIILKRRSDYLVIKTRYPLSTRMPFSDSEVERLILHKDETDVQLVIFYLYTGFRNEEGCSILKEDVNLSNMTIIGGAKTPSGTRRVIPIHPRIQPFVESWMNGPSKYLLTAPRGGKMYIGKVEDVFKEVSSLYCDRPHIPHECRHTLQTRLDAMHADRICINKIMGHKPAVVSDRIYSHRSLEELRAAIMLLW